jgi:hypothetical protein
MVHSTDHAPSVAAAGQPVLTFRTSGLPGAATPSPFASSGGLPMPPRLSASHVQLPGIASTVWTVCRIASENVLPLLISFRVVLSIGMDVPSWLFPAAADRQNGQHGLHHIRIS